MLLIADMRRDWKLRELRCARDTLQAQVACLQADGALTASRLAQAQEKTAAARAEAQVSRSPRCPQLG